MVKRIFEKFLSCRFDFKKLFLILFFAGIFLIVLLGFGKGDIDGFCSKDFVLIELQYANENFELVDYSIENGCVPMRLGGFEFYFSLESEEKIFYSGKFDVVNFFVDNLEEGELTGDVVELEESVVFLVAPYFSDAEDLRISGKGDEWFWESVNKLGAVSCRVE